MMLRVLPYETPLDDLLVHCSHLGASRIQIQTDQPVEIRLHGKNLTLTDDIWSSHRVRDALFHIYGDSTADIVLTQADAIDLSHTIWPNRKARRHSFRINAVAATIGPERGINMTIRPLADIPRKLEEQNIEPRLKDALEGDNGGYLICGATGSGKTTLMGGINRDRLENPDCHCNIVEGSAPLELLYDLVKRQNATISQSEIPKQLQTFPDFIRAAMRQEPTDIVVGECRDPQTVEAAIQAMISGHRLMSSIHTFDPPSTLRRVEALCPSDQRDSLIIAFVENLKLIVNQRLLPSTDGKRTPIREFLPVTRTLRNRLLDTPREQWPAITREAVNTQGQTYLQSIAQALTEKRITEDVARKARDAEF
ncbi:MAG: ATPase, T2SS/T4P/T4SS family [Acetobacter syzygii]|uniref:type IV pilus twitching motility protein PilT n=1 Tax=Acetobacter syzygii TaxID=146476 RepID=UPI0039E7C000